MNTFKRSIVAVLMTGAVIAARGEDVLISAAASLKDALTELTPMVLKETGATLVPNLAASGVLARQIDSGAPADIFVSADEATMDTLDKGGKLLPNSRVDLLSNVLVVAVPNASTLKIDSAKSITQAGIKKLAIGDPASVPAGQYAVKFLQEQKAYDDVKDRLVPLENVRAVLTAVESGNADAGMVYKSDMMVAKQSKAAWTIPSDIGPRILYPMAIVKDTKHAELAQKVRTFLMSKAATDVFVKWGFILPPVPKSATTTGTAGSQATAPATSPAAAPASAAGTATK